MAVKLIKDSFSNEEGCEKAKKKPIKKNMKEDFEQGSSEALEQAVQLAIEELGDGLKDLRPTVYNIEIDFSSDEIYVEFAGNTLIIYPVVRSKDKTITFYIRDIRINRETINAAGLMKLGNDLHTIGNFLNNNIGLLQY